MNIIHKYPLPDRENRVAMPRNARILCVQTQKETPTLWVLVDPAEPVVFRKFHLIMTGEDFLSTNLNYIGTCQVGGGSFVAHVFEEREVMSNLVPVKAIAWTNGMLMVFDSHGQQIPKYQGVTTEKLPELLKRHPEIEVVHAKWGESAVGLFINVDEKP